MTITNVQELLKKRPEDARAISKKLREESPKEREDIYQFLLKIKTPLWLIAQITYQKRHDIDPGKTFRFLKNKGHSLKEAYETFKPLDLNEKHIQAILHRGYELNYYEIYNFILGKTRDYVYAATVILDESGLNSCGMGTEGRADMVVRFMKSKRYTVQQVCETLGNRRGFYPFYLLKPLKKYYNASNETITLALKCGPKYSVKKMKEFWKNETIETQLVLLRQVRFQRSAIISQYSDTPEELKAYYQEFGRLLEIGQHLKNNKQNCGFLDVAEILFSLSTSINPYIETVKTLYKIYGGDSRIYNWINKKCIQENEIMNIFFLAIGVEGILIIPEGQDPKEIFIKFSEILDCRENNLDEKIKLLELYNASHPIQKARLMCQCKIPYRSIRTALKKILVEDAKIMLDLFLDPVVGDSNIFHAVSNMKLVGYSMKKTLIAVEKKLSISHFEALEFFRETYSAKHAVRSLACIGASLSNIKLHVQYYWKIDDNDICELITKHKIQEVTSESLFRFLIDSTDVANASIIYKKYSTLVETIKLAKEHNPRNKEWKTIFNHFNISQEKQAENLIEMDWQPHAIIPFLKIDFFDIPKWTKFFVNCQYSISEIINTFYDYFSLTPVLIIPQVIKGTDSTIADVVCDIDMEVNTLTQCIPYMTIPDEEKANALKVLIEYNTSTSDLIKLIINENN